MVHRLQYGDGVASTLRPPFSKSHSQSFTAGSNPNSAPMPSYSSQPRRQSQPSVSTRQYTPQPEPAFDLMSSAQPMFGDVNFQLTDMPFDLHAAMSMAPSTSSYNTPGLPSANFPSHSPFDVSTAPYMPCGSGLAGYDVNGFTTSATTNTAVTAAAAAVALAVSTGLPASTPDFGPLNCPEDTSFARQALTPSANKIESPFASNGPILAPPAVKVEASTTDSMLKNPPQTPRKSAKAKPSTAPRNQPLLPAPAGSTKTSPSQHGSTASAVKRALPDSPTLEHTSPRKAAKRSKTDEPGRHRDLVPIPDAEAFPPVDAGEDNAKPPYTYAQMIALAIWKAPSRRRTLSQIYDFIRTTWCYYRRDDTWENSIRHNLSLHKKFFDKQARAKDDPGKGNYWLIIPGNERELLDVYLKERPSSDGAISGKNMGVLSTARLESSVLPAPLAHAFAEAVLPPQIGDFRLQFQQIPNLPPPTPRQPEPSSDATIPVSDTFEESELANETHYTHPLDATLTSSPPAVSRRESAPSHTPTPAARQRPSFGWTSGKRKRYSMVDSGYMTGVESSILRYGQQRVPVFSSDADHEFLGGGRAEDAIRKMRASSSDSPSVGRNQMLPPSSPLGKSSPLRQRASPTKLIAAAAKTPATTKRPFAGTPNLAPPKTTTTSKYDNSPIRQHDKLRASVRSMLETPQCVREYNSLYTGRRSNRGGDFDSFTIFEDNTSGPELESPLAANSAGRLLDELLSAKKNHKITLIPASPSHILGTYHLEDENTPWLYDSPSKVVSSARSLATSPSKFLPSTKAPGQQDTENWAVTGEDEVDLKNLGTLGDSAALDLTQTFRSIGERPMGLEPYGPSTLHRYG